MRETVVSIASYVYEPHLRQGYDAELGVPYMWLDWDQYGDPGPEATVLTPFKAVIVENKYLQLTILPELGGRIYECIVKSAGQNIFYRNLVLKPTHWGPLTRDQNWWLAAGGMEWAFPVNEHGYEWGSPWSYSVRRSEGETTVRMSDSADDRLRMTVEITVAPASAYFTVSPRIENPTTSTVTYQYWTNAMLTLGSSSMSPNTEFVYPTEEVIVHSTGPGSGLPGERSRISWPIHEGRDMAWYENWLDWLGFFVPEPTEDFVAAYNHDTTLGVARVFPRQEAPGVKLFAWGQESPLTSEYTDDGSQYFEIWGGANRTFWPEDDCTLGPGETKAWTEWWYPFLQTGGVTFANREAVLNLDKEEGSLRLGVATTADRMGSVVLTLGEEELYRQEVTVSPDRPHLHQLPVPAAAPPTALVSLRFLDSGGQVIAQYGERMTLP